MIALLADSVLIPFPPGTHADTRLTAGWFASIFWNRLLAVCSYYCCRASAFRRHQSSDSCQSESPDHSPRPIHDHRHIRGLNLTEFFPCLFSSFCRFPGSAVRPDCQGCGSGGRHHIANSGRRRSSWFWSRSTIALCIWLTRLSERSSVAPISFIVSSS